VPPTAAGIVHTHGYRPDVVDAGRRAAAGQSPPSRQSRLHLGRLETPAVRALQRRAYGALTRCRSLAPLVELLTRDGIPRTSALRQNAWLESTPRSIVRRRDGPWFARRRVLIGWAGALERREGADVLLDALVKLTICPSRLRGGGRTGAPIARLAGVALMALSGSSACTGRSRADGCSPPSTSSS